MDGESPIIVVEERVREETGVSRAYIEQRAQLELKEIERRRVLYLADRKPITVADRTAIIVDDGIATGTTMRVAIRGLRQRAPARLVLAVPVAPPETIDELTPEVDTIVCLLQPPMFRAIGLYYRDFHQLSDDEVIAMLREAPRAAQPADQ